MPQVPRDKIDDVRDRTNIVEIVKRHVELKRAGTGSWKGLCPFHSEKTPSFNVHEPRQFFYCFGCGEKGDAISFLMKIEQRPFADVLRDLAASAGVELEERPLTQAERRAREQQVSEKERMLRALDLAAGFFEEQYAGPAGAAARAYVEGRAIGREVRERFRIGYAPARWDALSSYLAANKIPASDMERLGLVGVNDRGRYDFFRDRVMLPVIDRQKRVIGFGGRLLDPDAKDRKYVNSPDSPLFHKKEQLYGLHAALDAIRKSNSAIVVEGNFDVLALHEAGIEEAVAPMGTALTVEQVGMVGRLAKTVTVVFDGDPAGQRAAAKAIPLFVDADVDGRVARLPPGIDPDDFVRLNGADAFRRLLEAARPMLDQFIQDNIADSTIPGRVAVLERVAALLVRVKDPTTRELYARRVAGVLQIEQHLVTRALRDAANANKEHRPAAGGAAIRTPDADAPARPPVRLPDEELEALVLVARHPELLRTPDAARMGELLVHPAARQLHRMAIEQGGGLGKLDLGAWLEGAPAELATAISSALMSGHLAEISDPAGFLAMLVFRLELLRVEAEISLNGRLQRDAHARGNEQEMLALTSRGIELSKTKEGLKTALRGLKEK